MGLPKFKPEENKQPKVEGVNLLDTLKEPELGEVSGDSVALNNADDNDDDDKEVAIDGFPRLDDFDCFICWKCVNKNKEFFDLIKDDDAIVEDHLQRIVSESLEDRNNKIRDQSGLLNAIKRRRIEYDYSIFLKANHEENFTKSLNEVPAESSNSKVFKAFFISFPFLLKDYPIYEPPQDEDDDGNSSIYDLGSKVINSLPREKAIQGVEAYQQIKDKLKTFLTPFAQDGKVVNKEDIEAFFSDFRKEK
jgi:E3 ubiquitin-protein ligase UBR7